MSLGVDNSDILNKITEFFKDRSDLSKLVLDSTGANITLETLYKITKNEVISSQLFVSKYESHFFNSLSDAFMKMTSKSTLIRIPELNLYLVCDDIVKCISLIDRVYNYSIPHDMRPPRLVGKYDFSPYQLVFTDVVQRVVFRMIGTDEDAEHVEKSCKLLFGKDIVIKITADVIYKQFTLKIIVENFDAAKNKVDELEKFINNSNLNLSDRFEIHKLKVRDYNGKSYTMSLICNSDYVGYKGHPLPDTEKYLQRNANDEFTKVEIIDSPQIKDVKKIKEDLMNQAAEKWVSNLIATGGLKHPIYTKVIYSQYVSDNPSHLSTSNLANIITQYGYENKRNKEGRHVWALSSISVK